MSLVTIISTNKLYRIIFNISGTSQLPIHRKKRSTTFPSLSASFMQNAIQSMASKRQDFGLTIRRIRRLGYETKLALQIFLCMPFLLAGPIHKTLPQLGFPITQHPTPANVLNAENTVYWVFFQLLWTL